MKGVRYTYPSGRVVEFTHNSGCTPKSPEEWVAAHKRVAKRATVEEIESDVPLNRYKDGDGPWKQVPE